MDEAALQCLQVFTKLQVLAVHDVVISCGFSKAGNGSSSSGTSGSSTEQRQARAVACARQVANPVCACTSLQQLDLQLSIEQGYVLDAAAFDFSNMTRLKRLQVGHVHMGPAFADSSAAAAAQRGTMLAAHLPLLSCCHVATGDC